MKASETHDRLVEGSRRAVVAVQGLWILENRQLKIQEKNETIP